MVDDKPKTATETMMRLSMEEDRLEYRDRRVALSVAAQMVEKYFDPTRFEDVEENRHEILRQMTRAAEHAAYEAIQRDRADHAEDMKVLEHFAKAKFDLAMLTPPGFVIPKPIQ